MCTFVGHRWGTHPAHPLESIAVGRKRYVGGLFSCEWQEGEEGKTGVANAVVGARWGASSTIVRQRQAFKTASPSVIECVWSGI